MTEEMSGSNPRVIFAEPLDLEEEEDDNEKQDEGSGAVDDESDIMEDIPIRKQRKFDEEEMLAANQELLLTRHFKLEKEYGAAYTGGAFAILKDARYGLGLKDAKINLIEIDTGRVLGTLAEENEDIISFTVSPNQKILVTATKSYMVKAYRLADSIDESIESWAPENFQTFRLVGSLALELCVDPSSRFVAVGTTDSQIKVYDL